MIPIGLELAAREPAELLVMRHRPTFAVEPWLRIRGTIWELWVRHNEEIASKGDRPLFDPDLGKFDDYAMANKAHWYVARENGKIIGYVFAIVDTHLHRRRQLCAFWDLYFLDKVYRKGWVGYKLLRGADRSLRARGVMKQYAGTKVWKDAGVIFRRMGWSKAEDQYTWTGA